MNPIVTGQLLGGVTGVGVGVGASKLYTKMTGKTAGAPASLAHILTNDKLDKQGKADVIKEQLIESGKDTLKLGATAAGIGGAAALACAKSSKAAGFFATAKTKIGNMLSKVSVGGKDLKEMVKGTKIFDKFNKLPAPAKVAIAVGAGVVALVAPLATLVSSQKAGYIEGKHEANSLKRSLNNENFLAKKCVAYKDGYKMGCVA